MIWLALALGFLNLLLWVLVGLLGWAAYRKARPMLAMFGLGSMLAGPTGPPVGAGPAEFPPEPAGPLPAPQDTCDYPGCELALGHLYSDHASYDKVTHEWVPLP